MTTKNKDTKKIVTETDLDQLTTQFINQHKPEPQDLSAEQNHLLKSKIFHKLNIEKSLKNSAAPRWFWAPAVGSFAVIVFAFILNNTTQVLIPQKLNSVSHTQTVVAINSNLVTNSYKTDSNQIDEADSNSDDWTTLDETSPTQEVGSSYLDFVEAL